MGWSDAARQAAAEARKNHKANRNTAVMSVAHMSNRDINSVAKASVRARIAKDLRAIRAGKKTDNGASYEANRSTLARNLIRKQGASPFSTKGYKEK